MHWGQVVFAIFCIAQVHSGGMDPAINNIR
jgi:hypothetical protein